MKCEYEFSDKTKCGKDTFSSLDRQWLCNDHWDMVYKNNYPDNFRAYQSGRDGSATKLAMDQQLTEAGLVPVGVE